MKTRAYTTKTLFRLAALLVSLNLAACEGEGGEPEPVGPGGVGHGRAEGRTVDAPSPVAPVGLAQFVGDWKVAATVIQSSCAGRSARESVAVEDELWRITQGQVPGTIAVDDGRGCAFEAVVSGGVAVASAASCAGSATPKSIQLTLSGATMTAVTTTRIVASKFGWSCSLAEETTLVRR